MTKTDPPQGSRWLRLPRLSPGAWVLLALATGTAPWLAMLLSLF